MKRFKKTMALTAACVIAATAVNVGAVGVNDVPKVTLGNIVAAAAEQNDFKSATADGKEKVEDTKTIELIFQSAPGDLTGKISILDGKAKIDSISAKQDDDKKVILAISDIQVADSEQITIKLENTDQFTFNPEQKSTIVYKAVPLTEVGAESAVVGNDEKEKIIVTLDGKRPHTVPENSKSGFKIDGKTVSSVVLDQGKIKVTINEAVQANEDLTLTYDPAELSYENRVKVDDANTVAGKFSVKVTNNVEPTHKHEIEKVEVLDGVKDVLASSKIKVTFKEAANGLSEKDFALSAAKVTTAKTTDNGKSYTLDITDISSGEQMLSSKKIDHGFTGDARSFKVFVKTAKGDGAYSQSSVRPDSSAPSKNEMKKDDMKKDEMKKEEPKKDEMKKDDMSNMEKSTDKVSTKLVIGKKTYTAMINGQAVEKTMDVAPMVHMGRTVLPARMISELLGVDVKFDQASKTASFMYGEGNKVELTLGQKFMMVNGEKVALTADILNKDGRILLPVTDIQKAFAKLGLEANVSWNAATKTVTIEK